MSKDPFQIVSDEITLIRGEIAKLQRTSLNKDEAKVLNDAVMGAAYRMAKATKDAPAEIQEALQFDREQMALNAQEAATKAAKSVMADIRKDLDHERAQFSKAAGEARSEAWRWFGGFWVWLIAMLATGTVIGALAAIWIQGRADASEFGQFPGIYCGRAGGQKMETETWTYCAVPIEEKAPNQ